jgi:hypothetical protein
VFYEKYAILSLALCYESNLIALLNDKCKSESPDYQSTDLNIGIEVAEAITTRQGTHRSIVNQYFGKGLQGQDIKEAAEKRYPKIIGRISVCDGHAVYSEHDGLSNFRGHIELIRQRIYQKTEKLNNGYKIFARNWLYIYAHVDLEPFDVDEVIKGIYSNHSLNYDKIFINCIDRLYVISDFDNFEVIEVEHEILRQIKAAAFE